MAFSWDDLSSKAKANPAAALPLDQQPGPMFKPPEPQPQPAEQEVKPTKTKKKAAPKGPSEDDREVAEFVAGLGVPRDANLDFVITQIDASLDRLTAAVKEIEDNLLSAKTVVKDAVSRTGNKE